MQIAKNLALQVWAYQFSIVADLNDTINLRLQYFCSKNHKQQSSLMQEILNLFLRPPEQASSGLIAF